MSTSACDQFTTADTAGGWSNGLNTDHPRQRDHQSAVVVEIEPAEAHGRTRTRFRSWNGKTGAFTAKTSPRTTKSVVVPGTLVRLLGVVERGVKNDQRDAQ